MEPGETLRRQHLFKTKYVLVQHLYSIFLFSLSLSRRQFPPRVHPHVWHVDGLCVRRNADGRHVMIDSWLCFGCVYPCWCDCFLIIITNGELEWTISEPTLLYSKKERERNRERERGGKDVQKGGDREGMAEWSLGGTVG